MWADDDHCHDSEVNHVQFIWDFCLRCHHHPLYIVLGITFVSAQLYVFRLFFVQFGRGIHYCSRAGQLAYGTGFGAGMVLSNALHLSIIHRAVFRLRTGPC